MITLFFQDKVIIFDATNNSKSQKDSFLYNNNTPDEIVELLKERATINLLCDDETAALAQFKSYFRLLTAAGGVVENERGEFLMIYRNERWDLPKGKLEKGESIEQCAIREVMEETGIDGITHRDKQAFTTHHFYNIYGGWEFKTTYWYKMSYNADSDKRQNRDFVPQKEEGITRVEWLTVEAANEAVINSYTSIKAVAERLF